MLNDDNIMLEDYKVIPYHFKKREITIIPLSDLHIGSHQCKLNQIKKMIKYINETPDTYTMLVGDICDNGVLTGKNIGVLENKLNPKEQRELAIELLRPLAENGKILCAVSGNHEMRSENATGLNPLQWICDSLNIENVYRRNMACVKIVLGSRVNNEGIGKAQCYTFIVHHGKGTNTNAIKKDFDTIYRIEGADIIVTGHIHKAYQGSDGALYVNKQENILTTRPKIVVIANAFLGDCDYALQNMMFGNLNTMSYIQIFSGKEKQIWTQQRT